MLTITITDPHLTSAHELRAVATMLATLASRHDPASERSEPVFTARMTSPATRIAADDAPNVGTPPASEVFVGGPDAATVFGATVPNAPAAPSTAGADPSSTALAASVFTSTMPGLVTSPPAPPGAPQAPNAAPPAPGPVGSHAPLVDAAGLPWDARIHSSSRTMNQGDGLWKNKRNVDPAQRAVVEGQLRSGLAANAAVQSAPPAPPAAQVFTAPPAPPPPPATPTPPVSQPTTPGAVAFDFPSILTRITGALNAGRLTQPELMQILAKYQIAMVPALAAAPAVIQYVSADLEALLATRGG